MIRGRSRYINEREPAGIIVHDGRLALFVDYGPKDSSTPENRLHPGDVIEVEGVSDGRRIRARRRTRRGPPGRALGAAPSQARVVRHAPQRRVRL